jgi:hypothetical protein
MPACLYSIVLLCFTLQAALADDMSDTEATADDHQPIIPHSGDIPAPRPMDGPQNSSQQPKGKRKRRGCRAGRRVQEARALAALEMAEESGDNSSDA